MPLSRTPPAGVRRQLRREIGFACPVAGCGSPYLSYHHFDPPWSEREHHDAAGMIAPCLQHHKEADTGVFTREQLLELKMRLNQADVRGSVNWARERTIFLAGGNVFTGCSVLIEANDEPAVWLTRDGDRELLNVDLRTANGEQLFRMEDNDWTCTPALDDIEAPPGTASLSVRSHGHDVALNLRFRAAPDEEAAKYARMIESARPPPPERRGLDVLLPRLRIPPPPASFLMCEIAGKIQWPFPVDFAPKRLTARPPDRPASVMEGNIFINLAGTSGLSLGGTRSTLISF